MEKMLLTTLFGIALLSVLSNAQDIGRMRRMMLLRQRDLALRRAAFPFGMIGIGGPGIPPAVAARLALIQRQRALSNPFLRSSLGPMGSPFSLSSPGAAFGMRGPFGSPLSFPGPTDISRFDLATLGFSNGAAFGDSGGLTAVGRGGLNRVGPVGQTVANGPQGGSGNIFGQQPTQAAEFLETNRGTVEARSGSDERMPGQPSRLPSRPGFRPREAGATASRPEVQRLQRSQNGPSVDGRRPPQQMSEETFPSPPQPPPHLSPPLSPRVLPPPQDVIFPPLSQGRQPWAPSDSRRLLRPPRRGWRNQRRGRRPQRQRQGRRQRGPRVFPNVPEVVQIPAVTASSQGQAGGGQMGTGLTQARPDQMSGQSGQMGGQPGGQMGVQMGGQQGGQMPGPFGRPVGGPFGGQMSGQFGSQMSSPSFSFGQSSGGQFPTGLQSQGVQGSAIFPSQATQGPIMRQRGPSFRADGTFTSGLDFSSPSTINPGFPNGPALRFPGGAQSFGQNDRFLFQTGGLRPDVLTTGQFPPTGFQGFPGATFGPGLERTASSGPTVPGQSFGGSGSQNQMAQNFGFVRPANGAAAGPAFNTGASSSPQNFNIQFQPLRPMQQVPQIPEQQPNQSQMGIGTGVPPNSVLNNGMSSQSGMQFGQSSPNTIQGSVSNQGGMQFGGSVQTGFQIDRTGSNSKFTSAGSTSVVETKANQQGDGMLPFGPGTQSLDSAATTVSERTVDTGASGGSTEFRLVEVGNILGNQGFVDNSASDGTVVTTVTVGGQQGSDFQPAGDISAAFQSFGAVDGFEGVVDLSLQPDVTTGTGSTTEQLSAMEIAALSKSDSTGNTIGTGNAAVTNTSETKSAIPLQDSPFARSINQDFSFFMAENNQTPNDMPPITFTAPEPPAMEPAGTTILTFPVQGTGGTAKEASNTSQSGFNFSTNTVTSTEGKTTAGAGQADTTAVAGETNTTIGGFL